MKYGETIFPLKENLKEKDTKINIVFKGSIPCITKNNIHEVFFKNSMIQITKATRFPHFLNIIY